MFNSKQKPVLLFAQALIIGQINQFLTNLIRMSERQ